MFLIDDAFFSTVGIEMSTRTCTKQICTSHVHSHTQLKKWVLLVFIPN